MNSFCIYLNPDVCKNKNVHTHLNKFFEQDQSIDRLIDQSIHQSINQSINQSKSFTINDQT